MEEKKEKKGFWASLFAPKPCSCSCGMQIIEEFDAATGNANPSMPKLRNRTVATILRGTVVNERIDSG